MGLPKRAIRPGGRPSARTRRRWGVATSFGSLMALGLSGCAQPAHSSPANVVSLASTQTPASDSPVPLHGAPGGDFATLPALPTPMIVSKAVLAARQAGSGRVGPTATSSPLSPEAATAPASTLVTSYADFLARTGQSAQQLGATNTVVVVTIHAPYYAIDAPLAPGAKPQTWPQYTLAFDARSGYTLYKGPIPVADRG